MVTYECKHCKGVCRIKVVKESDKATLPEIEFCPICGMADEYPLERSPTSPAD